MAREHPVFNYARTFMSLGTQLVAQSLAFRAFGGEVSLLAILGVNGVVFLHNAAGMGVEDVGDEAGLGVDVLAEELRGLRRFQRAGVRLRGLDV